MKGEFEGKVILITGSSMGIGKAMAHHFAQRGAKLVINARNQQKLANTREELTRAGYDVLDIAADVSQYEEVNRMIQQTIEHYGQLDILINNAGIATRGSIEHMSADVFERVLRVNVLGSVFPSKAALPYIAKQQGSIIYISSIASFHGLPYNSIYSSSKKALTAFSESLRLEAKEKGVHVGLAYVGFTENDPQKIILDADGQRIYLENRQGIKKQTPEKVASIIAGLIRKRKKTITLSPSGKALKWVHRFFPSVISLIYTSNLRKIKAQSEGDPRYVEEKTGQEK